MSNSMHRPSLTTAVFYKDPRAALDWLERAFGFERTMVITDRDNNLVHAEMKYGDGCIMLGSEWADFVASPTSVGGKNTQMVHVQLKDGIGAHCDRAKAAGAVILQGPTDQFYGDRTYRARDPEGHIWTFAQHTHDVSREDAEQATGLNIDGWH